MIRAARHTRALVLAAGLLAAASARAEVIVCNFTGTAPGANTPWTATTELRPNLTFSGWVRGTGAIARPEIHNAFGFHVNAPGETESPLTQAIAEHEYIAFTLTPAPGHPLDLNGLEVAFAIQRVTWHAARRYALMTSIGGFTPEAAVFTTRKFDSGDFTNEEFRFFLPQSGYGPLIAPVEFRLYAYEANYNHATSLTSFSITRYGGPVVALNLSAEPGGAISSVPQGTLFRGGTEVKVHAAPAAGQRFAGWSGDLTGKGNPLTLTLDTTTTLVANFAPEPPRVMEVGTNLGGVADWTTDWPFRDMFKKTRDWRTRNADGSGGWDTNQDAHIPRDANGYPTALPFTPPSGTPQMVHTILLHFHSPGPYRLIVEGTGRLRYGVTGSPAQTVDVTGGTTQIPLNVPSTTATFTLELHESLASDPLRAIRLVPDVFLATYESDPFHPLYVERLDGFRSLRFMDWGETNASPLATWASRTTPASITQTRRQGVALEYMAELSNRARQDLWVCIPHLADDDYVSRTAQLLDAMLDADLRIYVEYSNETWNTAGPFPQSGYIQDQGEALALAPTRWEAGQCYAVLRSIQIWNIFEAEMTNPARLVRVLGTHAGNYSTTQLRVNALNNPAINPARIMPDALAIAPYFGLTYSPAQITANGYPTVDAIVTTISGNLINGSSRSMTAQHLQLCNEQGWRLVCYEGGQHFVGTAGAENDDNLTAILHAANRDPRMYDRYREYLDMLQEEGVDHFSNFSYVSEPSKWGSWGVLEQQDQPLSEAHKYRALIDWIAAQQGSRVTSWDGYAGGNFGGR